MPLELGTKADVSTSASTSKWFSLGKKGSALGSKDRMFFTEQLALLLETGTALHAALKLMMAQIENPLMREVVDEISLDISEGRTFSHALSKHPTLFSSTYVSLISASENGGFMHEVLVQLLEMEEKRERLKNTLSSALSYPVFLMAFSAAVVIFVLVVVFPKFADMFAKIHDELPLTTKILMASSDVLINQWYWVVGIIATIAISAVYWLRTDAGKLRVDRFKLETPGFKSIFIRLYLLQVMRVMSLSLANGVNIIESLKACQDVVDNRVFQNFLVEVEETVQEGSGIAYGFSQSELMPALTRQMIATGEETGNLPKVMARIADFYERELGKKVSKISKMAEPVMLIVMGLVVGLIVSSLILPIFQLSRAAM